MRVQVLTKLCGVLCLVVALLPRAARGADIPRAKLVYLRDEAAQRCPGEGALRTQVSERLGVDPFEPGGARVLRVIVEGEGAGFVAHIELRGGPEGLVERDIAAQSSCEELIAAAALSVSLAFDALGEGDASNATPNAAPSAPTPAASVVALPASAPSASPAAQSSPSAPLRTTESADLREQRVRLPVEMAAGLHLGVSVGAAPSASGRGDLFVRGRRRELSLGFELRADAPVSRSLADGGSFNIGSLAAGLAPCWHVSVARGCALVTGGQVWAKSKNLAQSRADLSWFGALGARAGLEWPLHRPWAFSAQADLLWRMAPLGAVVDGETVWAAPRVFASFGLGAFARF